MTVFGIAESQAIAKTIAKEQGLTVVEDRDAKRPSVSGNVITVPPPTIYNHKEYMQELHACINQASKPNKFLEIEVENDKQKILLDIIRDMHCDRLEQGEYRGRDKQLLKRYQERDIPFKDIAQEDKDIARMLALGDDLRSEWQGTSPKKMPQELRDDLKRMQHIGDQWMSLRTEEDVRKLLKYLEEEEMPQGGGGDGDSEGNPSGEDRGSQGEGEGTQEGDQGGDSRDEGEEGTGEAEGDGESEGEGEGSPTDMDGNREVSDDLKDKISDIIPDYKEEPQSDITGTPKYDEPYRPHGDMTILDSTKGGHMYNSSRVEASERYLGGFTLSKRIRKYLLTLIQTRTQTGLRAGKFAPNKISRLLTDKTPGKQPRIYKKTLNSVVNTDIAFSILLDHSGSMGGSRYNISAACAVAIHEVLAAINISHDIATFSTENFERCPPVHHIVKKYGERFVPRDTLFQRLHNSNHWLFNNNADGESVLYAMRSLIKRPEKEKVLIVLSDGQPACHSSFGDSDRYLKDVVRQIEETPGVDVLGIGIETNSVRRYYTRNRVLRSVTELETIMVDLVKEKVIR